MNYCSIMTIVVKSIQIWGGLINEVKHVVDIFGDANHLTFSTLQHVTS